MNATLSHLLGRRMWLISGIVVWGGMADFEPEMILTETDGETKRILHGRFAIGGSTQVIAFSDLVDQRGNKLPAFILNPAVIPIPRCDANVAVLGTVAADSFRLSQSAPAGKSVTTDLLIIEMG